MCVTPPPMIDPMMPSTIVQKIAMCTCITDFAIMPEILLVRKMSQLHRFDDATRNHCRTESGTESEKKHPASLV
jgi:hypothetical protein